MSRKPSLTQIDQTVLSALTSDIFDKGYISFEDDGSILISKRIDRSEFERLGVHEGMPGKKFSASQATYLEFHRTEIFKR